MSTRTHYRDLRKLLRLELATLSLHLLTLNTTEIERIDLKDFKKTKKILQDMLNTANSN